MADITTTRLFTDGERGITAAKLNDIQGGASIQPAFFSAKPLASSLAGDDTMLVLKNTGSYAKTPFQTVIDSISASISSDTEIWSVRLRSFNAMGNPNFEVDQRNILQGLSNPSGNTFIQDRWSVSRNGAATMTGNWNPTTGAIVIPSTNYVITRIFLHYVLLTQQASLAATDTHGIVQTIEGANFRELYGDVMSISLLVRSSVAGLKFSVSIRDSPPTKSLVKLCTIPSANVWTLIQLPNIPAIPAGGNFGINPGTVGAIAGIFFCSGSTFIAPAADTWQTGNFIGAPGMSNFGASPVNSTIDFAMIQLEPGPVCSTFIDKPFVQNLTESQRYYYKSYNYGVKPGAASSQLGEVMIPALANAQGYAGIPFKSTMAKIPTITAYDPVGGAAAGVYDLGASAARTVSGIVNAGESGFGGVSLTTPNAANTTYLLQYTADAGW